MRSRLLVDGFLRVVAGSGLRSAEQLQKPIAFVLFIVLVGGIESRFHLLGAQTLRHEVRDLLGFLVGVVHVEEGCRIAEVQVRLFVLLLQDLEDSEVAANPFDVRFCEQVDDLGTVLLAIAIDAAVALLKHHQRPGQVEVHQAMTEEMEIQSLGCDVRAQQHPNGIIEPAETVNKLLLIGVWELAMQQCDLRGLQREVSRQFPLQPPQRLKPLRKHNEAIRRVCR